MSFSMQTEVMKMAVAEAERRLAEAERRVHNNLVASLRHAVDCRLDTAGQGLYDLSTAGADI